MSYFRGASTAIPEKAPPRPRVRRKPEPEGKLSQCSECGDCWKTGMLDECVACGLGADTDGICPKCMREHRCTNDRRTE